MPLSFSVSNLNCPLFQTILICWHPGIDANVLTLKGFYEIGKKKKIGGLGEYLRTKTRWLYSLSKCEGRVGIVLATGQELRKSESPSVRKTQDT